VKAVQKHFWTWIALRVSQLSCQRSAPARPAGGRRGRGREVDRKFWEMHDQLFEHQDRLKALDLVRYAAEIGIDSG
jgi:hypothetical protein